MQCFSIYLNFSGFPGPLSNLGQTPDAFDVCQVGWEPKFGVGSRVPLLRAHTYIFSKNFGGAFLVALVQNWI
jgi:hypothetical protein